MPQRIVPNKIVAITKEGECQVTITLELNININGGQLDVSSSVEQVDTASTEWAIPEFGSNLNPLHFGKDVENEN
jgi:hypothetical protein